MKINDYNEGEKELDGNEKQKFEIKNPELSLKILEFVWSQ